METSLFFILLRCCLRSIILDYFGGFNKVSGLCRGPAPSRWLIIDLEAVFALVIV